MGALSVAPDEPSSQSTAPALAPPTTTLTGLAQGLVPSTRTTSAGNGRKTQDRAGMSHSDLTFGG
jgi:hypothetical protein